MVGVDQLQPGLCAELAALEPCGQGNPEPLLALCGARVLGTSTFGAQRQHLRVALTDASGQVVEAIAFNKPGLCGHLPAGRLVDACFGLELDRWDGVERIRLRLRDLRPARQDPTLMTAAALTGALVA